MAAADRHKVWLGIMAALAAMMIYAMNLLVTRYVVRSTLTAFDLVAMRFAVAGLLMLPYLAGRGLGRLGGVGWARGAVLATLGGAPYMLILLGGLHFAPASHGSALNPGTVPIVAALGMWVSEGIRVRPLKLAAMGLVLAGLALVTSYSISNTTLLLGDGLILLSGLSWGAFTVLIRRWRIDPVLGAAIVSVLSLAYLPVYGLLPHPGLASAPLWVCLFHAFNQGVLNAILALILFTYAIQAIGASRAALFSPLVPILTTLGGIPLLAEVPTPVQWLGIALVGIGMFAAARLN